MLCVGINDYAVPANISKCKVCSLRGLKNLNGCLNDIDTITKTFIKYYDFKPGNIVQLLDRKATRKAILDSLRWLAGKCRKGDIVVFYYSGHGSYEWEHKTDGLLKTGKGYRNTILPADITDSSVHDINSVELNQAFARFTDKGVTLTVITDCCNSATNTRGSTLFEVDSAREANPAPNAYLSLGEPTAATRKLDLYGALTIGSCQDNEIAAETEVMPGKFYGAFTINLCKAITEWSQAPLQTIIDRTVSKLRIGNKQQTPHFEGMKRLEWNLPGSARAQQRKSTYLLKCLHCSKNGLPELMGGFMDDISIDDILVDMNSKDSIRVNNVGLSETEVMVINKTGQLKNVNLGGLNFSILKKIPNPDPPLKVFLGYSVSSEELQVMTKAAIQLQHQKNIPYHWIEPSAEKIPDAVLFYSENKEGAGRWKLNRNKVKEITRLEGLNDPNIKALLDSANSMNAYLQLPSTKIMEELIQQKLLLLKNRNIKLVASPDAADYVLAGHINASGNLSYGWEKSILSDRHMDLPVNTDFYLLSASVESMVDSLMDKLTRLGVLANWLSMKSPAPDNALPYPYHLQVRKLGSKEWVKNRNVKEKESVDSFDIHEKLEILLVKDNGVTIKPDSIPSLFIYLMYMDPHGNTNLVYPRATESILKYPNQLVSEDSLSLVKVQHNYAGKYHYFFMALREQVSSKSVFSGESVLRGDQTLLTDNPLEDILNAAGTTQRGEIRSFDHWIFKAIDIFSEERNRKEN